MGGLFVLTEATVKEKRDKNQRQVRDRNVKGSGFRVEKLECFKSYSVISLNIPYSCMYIIFDTLH